MLIFLVALSFFENPFNDFVDCVTKREKTTDEIATGLTTTKSLVDISILSLGPAEGCKA